MLKGKSWKQHLEELNGAFPVKSFFSFYFLVLGAAFFGHGVGVAIFDFQVSNDTLFQTIIATFIGCCFASLTKKALAK